MRRFLLATTAALLVLLFWGAGESHAGSCTDGLEGASRSELISAIRCLEDKTSGLNARAGQGTAFIEVVAFDNVSCPPGWITYEPAAGRVVVGAQFDPKVRAPKVGEKGTWGKDNTSTGQRWLALLYCRRL